MFKDLKNCILKETTHREDFTLLIHFQQAISHGFAAFSPTSPSLVTADLHSRTGLQVDPCKGCMVIYTELKLMDAYWCLPPIESRQNEMLDKSKLTVTQWITLIVLHHRLYLIGLQTVINDFGWNNNISKRAFCHKQLTIFQPS